MSLKFRVELVWKGEDNGPEGEGTSIYLTSDGRVVVQGKRVSEAERKALALPADGELVSIDRALIRAIKEML